MVRIYTGLAVFATLLLVLTIVLGLRIGDLQSASQELLARRAEMREAQQSITRNPTAVEAAEKRVRDSTAAVRPLRDRAALHMLTGIAAALVTILVNSITVTYFIGTSRWCREVVAAYGLPDDLADDSARLKRSAFPWALLGIAAVLLISALGAASDPGAALKIGPSMPTYHYFAAALGTCLIVVAFWRQAQAITQNYQLIERVMEQVRQLRRQRGLT